VRPRPKPRAPSIKTRSEKGAAVCRTSHTFEPTTTRTLAWHAQLFCSPGDCAAYRRQRHGRRGNARRLENANGFNPTTPADAAEDADGDGSSTLSEYRAGTDPRNPASRFFITAIARTAGGVDLTWQSVSGRQYRVQYSDDLIGWSFVASSGAPVVVTAAGTSTSYPVAITDSAARIALRPCQCEGGCRSAMLVSFPTVSGKTCRLERSDTLADQWRATEQHRRYRRHGANHRHQRSRAVETILPCDCGMIDVQFPTPRIPA
jgi:hypothetical protein